MNKILLRVILAVSMLSNMAICAEQSNLFKQNKVAIETKECCNEKIEIQKIKDDIQQIKQNSDSIDKAKDEMLKVKSDSLDLIIKSTQYAIYIASGILILIGLVFGFYKNGSISSIKKEIKSDIEKHKNEKDKILADLESTKKEFREDLEKLKKTKIEELAQILQNRISKIEHDTQELTTAEAEDFSDEYEPRN